MIRWQSPRVLSLQTEPTRLEEADLVWSLGILLWEIVSLGELFDPLDFIH